MQTSDLSTVVRCFLNVTETENEDMMLWLRLPFWATKTSALILKATLLLKLAMHLASLNESCMTEGKPTHLKHLILQHCWTMLTLLNYAVLVHKTGMFTLKTSWGPCVQNLNSCWMGNQLSWELKYKAFTSVGGPLRYGKIPWWIAVRWLIGKTKMYRYVVRKVSISCMKFEMRNLCVFKDA